MMLTLTGFFRSVAMDACPQTFHDEYELPDAEALHAATLALMTGHAQQACPQRRSLMARKIRSNLFFLCQHPGLTPELRRVIQRLHGMWDALVQSGAADASPAVAGGPQAPVPWPPEPVAKHPPATWLQ
jgi:hypothetical protein